jgi:AAA+ ATPase superfamily predicted ATPase
MKYIGRAKQLKLLKELSSLQSSHLVVVNGRRRVGKSRLINEFAKNHHFLEFSGLAPVKGISAQDERDAFGQQFAQHFKLPPLSFNDWTDAFNHLSLQLEGNSTFTIILLDEISWMATGDDSFLPKLKNWWDLSLEKYSNRMLVLCGSVSTWIDENIINSTAFFGRISLHLVLEELSLPECYQFLQEMQFTQSYYDVFKMLSVTGGIPWYLKRIISSKSADENIRSLCFEKDGILVKEFEKIFHDLFHDRSIVYKKIIYLLSEGMLGLSAIREALKYPPGGALNKYLKDLITSGFVTKHYSWSLKNKKIGSGALYRLSDNYIRFYLKYIEVNLPKIEQNSYSTLSMNTFPGWDTMIGLQIENLLLKNRHLILQSLEISPQDIVADNPYIQKQTQRLKGCQIDYLIQTRTNNLYICEFKFNRRKMGTEIIAEVKEKIQRLSIPRGFGICPVLVHFDDIASGVYDANFFYRIIDMRDLLFN